MDSALNNQQWLICHKTKIANQPTLSFVRISLSQRPHYTVYERCDFHIQSIIAVLLEVLAKPLKVFEHSLHFTLQNVL